MSSADSAAKAAAAASESLTAQLALIPIDFSFELLPQRGSREARKPIASLRIASIGASVWLHSVAIKDVRKRYGSDGQWLNVRLDCASPKDPDTGDPLRLQSGEEWESLIVPSASGFQDLATTPRSDIVGLRIKVFYSLGKDDPGMSKTFTWRDPYQ